MTQSFCFLDRQIMFGRRKVSLGRGLRSGVPRKVVFFFFSFFLFFFARSVDFDRMDGWMDGWSGGSAE